MPLLEIASYIDAAEKNVSLLEASEFDQRMEVIDFIGFHVMDSLASLETTAPCSELTALQCRAAKIKSALEEVDRRLFERLRDTIRTTGCTGHAFKKLLGRYVDVTAPDSTGDPGYDNLDILINGLSPLQTMPQPTKDLEPDMVYFQKTPARIVFELVATARLEKEDVFFDIGAGLGQATILVHLLAGIKARGVEFEPAFCDYARECAAALHLPNVTFINADARTADYSEGTVFFMFTPFQGEILQAVLDILRKESLSRKISLFTYGPCTTHVAAEDWLYRVTPENGNVYTLAAFNSRL